MTHMGDIMSTVEGVPYSRRKIFCYLVPLVLMISPHGTQITKDGFPCYQHQRKSSNEILPEVDLQILFLIE